IADGYTVPTELVLVPMLFALPTPAVPLVVSISWGVGRLLDYVTGATNVQRAYLVFGDSWHAVGPTVALIAFGAQVFSWDHWPVYVAALAAQLVLDFGVNSTRMWLIDGTPIRDQLRLIAPVYGLDAALAPIGLL